MEEDIQPEAQVEVVKKKGISKKLAEALSARIRNFDRKARLRAKNPRAFRRRKKKLPLPNKNYRIIMNDEDKRKLGINPRW